MKNKRGGKTQTRTEGCFFPEDNRVLKKRPKNKGTLFSSTKVVQKILKNYLRTGIYVLLYGEFSGIKSPRKKPDQTKRYTTITPIQTESTSNDVTCTRTVTVSKIKKKDSRSMEAKGYLIR